MKRLRIYLDTSVINHLDAPDALNEQADTHKLWEDIQAGKYTVVMSELTFAEINKCPEPKRSFMREALECDIVLSWNFKHIVNLRAMTAVEAVNIKEGYKAIRILSPTMILEEE